MGAIAIPAGKLSEACPLAARNLRAVRNSRPQSRRPSETRPEDLEGKLRIVMNQSATAEVVATTTFETGLPDFHTLGVAGSIDLHTAGLRANGAAIEWHTPHHGMEIDLRAVLLLYRAADETLDAVLADGGATKVLISLTAVHQGIRLTIEADTGMPHEPGEALRTVLDLFGGIMTFGPILLPGTVAGSWNRVRVTLPLD